MTTRLTLAALLLVLAGSTAQAKPRKNSDKAEANKHFKAGVKHVDAGEHEEALAEFQAAYDIAPHPLVLFNIAGAHRQLKHYRDALNAYSSFVLEGDGVVSQELLERGKADMQELLSLVGRVSIDSHPQGARLFVDGEEVGKTPLAERLILSPGAHELRAELEGHRSIERSMNLAPGDMLELSLDMKAVQSSVNEGDGELALGKVAPSSPSRPISLSAGFGTNTLDIANTGAPTLGAFYELGQRISLGADLVLVAYSFMPQVQVHLLTGDTRVSLVGSAVLSSSGGDEPELFFAGAGGLRARQRLGERLAIYLSALVSYAGSEYGLSAPVFGGAELAF